jgi:phosphosulfolactate phosphohydrolase-like enzyme
MINKIVKVNHLRINEKLIITDTNGKTVSSVIGKNSIAEINMSKYSNGHYLARIISEKKSEIIKFLLM